MKFVVFDFETASACNLKKAGAWVYGEHPTTEIICLGFSIDGQAAMVWCPGVYATDNDPAAVALKAAVADPAVIFIAHNVAFEKSIWRNIMVAQLGWPPLPNERHHDTMASCAMKGIPLKLERAALALRLSSQKDTAGTRETLAFSRTNRRGNYDRAPEKVARVFAYNRSDVQAELELHRRVRGLGAAERRVWLLDQTINERGVRLDMDFVRQAQKVCDDASAPLAKEFEAITGLDKIGSPKFKDWLIEQGCPFPRDKEGKLDTSLDKAHVAKLLGVEDDENEENSLAGDDEDYSPEDPQLVLPLACRRPLEIRRILGSASIKKLASMQACCCSDGRARGLLQYHGAGSGRWAGRLLQPQNFPRPTLKVGGNPHDPDQLVDAIMTGDSEFVRMMFGEPIEAVASGLRHAIVASPGNLLEVGDFATIEACIVLAIAGAQKALNVLLSGQDIYIAMASQIFDIPPPDWNNKDAVKAWKKHHPEERQTGKNTVLGCGFQMGKVKFRMRYAADKPIEFAERCIKAYREEFAPEVPKLWRSLEDAATRCVWERLPIETYGIVYALEDGWLTCRLPSGRKLWYYDPKPVRKAMPWSTPDAPDIRPGFEYSALKMGQWKRISAYGGLLTENVVQATARDLLVHGMFNSEAAGHPIVLTVHDECINDVPEAIASDKLLEQYMTDIPAWAKALHIPVNAECWVGDRYKK